MYNDQPHQIIAKHPLPSCKSVTRFAIQYGGKDWGICLGILTEDRKFEVWSGDRGHEQSIGYWTYPKINKGNIFIDGEREK